MTPCSKERFTSACSCANGFPGSVVAHSAGSAANRAAVLICPHWKAWIVNTRGGIACLSSRYSSSQRCSPPAPAAAESSKSSPCGRTHRRARHRTSWPASPVRMTATRLRPTPNRPSLPRRNRPSPPGCKAIPRSNRAPLPGPPPRQAATVPRPPAVRARPIFDHKSDHDGSRKGAPRVASGGMQ
jgi:hypothetical protein